MLGPIFNREVLTVPRRTQHYVLRSLYLFVLWVLALTAWQAAFGWERDNSLGNLAFFGSLLFQLLSFLQLTLVLFFAALLAASAVTQEKDRRTFILLLMTDLSNSEIVLGKLFGSLLQIGALTACAVPVLALTLLLGGVALRQVLEAFLVLAASALAAGSLGCLLALWREKTFQTLALTVLALVLYVCIVEGVGAVLIDAQSLQTLGVEDWRALLNPFRAMYAVVDPPAAAGAGSLLAYGFAGSMVLLAVLLNGIGIGRLRAWNPRGEPIQQPEALDDREAGVDPTKRPIDIHAAPGKVRPVWANPVIWKEIMTRGYGRRPLLVKAAYLLVFALICIGVYRSLAGAGTGDRLFAAWGLTPVVVLSLLLLNAQAVTSITSERDLKSLELLLVSDLSPQEFIFGKLGGIFYNTKEIVLPPLILAVVYAFLGFIGWEMLFYILVTLIVLLAFTAVIGLHVSLHLANTRRAIGYSLGTIFALFVGTILCLYLISISRRFEFQWMSFILFLIAGIGGLMAVLGGLRQSMALNVAAGLCPPAVFYTLISILIGNPRTGETGDMLWSFVLMNFAFGFAVAAMLVPLLSEFEAVLEYTSPADE